MRLGFLGRIFLLYRAVTFINCAFCSSCCLGFLLLIAFLNPFPFLALLVLHRRCSLVLFGKLFFGRLFFFSSRLYRCSKLLDRFCLRSFWLCVLRLSATFLFLCSLLRLLLRFLRLIIDASFFLCGCNLFYLRYFLLLLSILLSVTG